MIQDTTNDPRASQRGAQGQETAGEPPAFFAVVSVPGYWASWRYSTRREAEEQAERLRSKYPEGEILVQDRQEAMGEERALLTEPETPD